MFVLVYTTDSQNCHPKQIRAKKTPATPHLHCIFYHSTGCSCSPMGRCGTASAGCSPMACRRGSWSWRRRTDANRQLKRLHGTMTKLKLARLREEELIPFSWRYHFLLLATFYKREKWKDVFFGRFPPHQLIIQWLMCWQLHDLRVNCSLFCSVNGFVPLPEVHWIGVLMNSTTIKIC